MPNLVDPRTGKTYDVPDEEVGTAQEKHGLITQAEADRQSGAAYATADDPTGQATVGLGGQVQAFGARATQKAAALGGLVTGQTAEQVAPMAFTPTARALTEANPKAAAIGGAVPAVTAGFLLPAAGAAGLASAVGLAGVDAASEEALNAELEGRSFDANKFVSTAGIDLALQAATHGVFKGLGYAYGKAAPAASNLASRFTKSMSRGAGEAEGVAAQKTLAESVKDAAQEVLSAPVPKVASNPIAQKSAIEDLAIQLGDGDPGIARSLREAAAGNAGQRYKALKDILETASDRQHDAISNVLERESLWGQKAVAHSKATEAARAAFPEVDDVADSVSTSQAHGIMRKEPEIVADLRKSLGGGTKAEKGHLQTWNDAMNVVSNSEKRGDYAKMFAELPEAARNEASTQLRELAQSSTAVVDALDSLGAKQGAKRLQGFIDAAIEDGTPAAADRLKNALQFQRKALAKKGVNDVLAENAAQIVDEFEQPLRHALETPEIVGDRIAELQRTRNKLWSDTEEGFIRNSQKLKANGFDMFNVVEVNYDTGKLVMQVDRKALDSLIAAPQHIAQPALENLEAMARSTKAMADDLTRLGGGANKAEARTLKSASEGILDKVRGIRELHAAREATGASGVGFATDVAAEAAGRVAGVVPGVGGFAKSAVKGATNRLGEMFGSQQVARKAVDVDAVAGFVDALRSHPAGSAAAQRVDESLGRYVMTRAGGGRSAVENAGRGAARAAPEAAAPTSLPERPSPVNLEGRTLEDMKALPLDGEAVNGGKSDLERVSDLTRDPTFSSTGRVASNDGRKGITLVDDAGELVLRDGRHRLQAARDLGRDDVWGNVVHGETGKELYQGPIPLKAPPAPAAPTLAPIADEAAAHLENRWTVQTRDAAKGIATPSLARKLPRSAAAAGAPSLSRFLGSDKTLSQAYDRTKDQVAALQVDALADSSAEDVAGVSPQLQQEALRQQARVMTYIQSITPKPVGVSVVRPKGRPASYQEMRDYALRVDAATHPEGVFEDAAHGLLRREQVEALQACWPQRYEDLKQQTILALANGSTTTSRQRAALLFNLGPEIDQALGAGVSALAAAARAKQATAKPGTGAAPPKRATPKSMASVVPAGQAALNIGNQLAMGQN